METGSKKTGAIAELNLAVKRFNQGQFEDARKICEGILVKDPDNVTALNILGGSLARAGKIKQAIQAAERVCHLSPGNAVFYSNLSYLYSVAGHVPKAVLAMAHAVISDAKNPGFQNKFAKLVNNLEFYVLAAEITPVKEAINICLDNQVTDAGSFSTAWHSLLLLNPAFIEFANITQDGCFKKQADAMNFQALAQPLAEPFLLLGLKSLLATTAKFERIMTFFRYVFISRFGDYDAELFLPFLCALAEHCNLNEYVYSLTTEERVLVEALEDSLDLSAKIDGDDMVRIALVSCYKDLMKLDCANSIAVASAELQNDAFTHLIKIMISVPTKIGEYRDSISAVWSSDGSLQNVVSSSVAKQYEENPYPRWRHLEIPLPSKQQSEKGRGRNILIAGCGTGYEALNLATLYPEAHILGVDLSLASLAYGKQKAAEFGIENIEFMQTDILGLDQLGRQFDLISSVGVLHHMEDPVAGWSNLLTCLESDGFMKIGLYSEIARKSVVLCRDWIKEQGFESTPEGIRQFRQAVMDLDAENPLKDITNWTDFFSLSMCRDLVFHVQEQRVTLPWIKSALDDLGLSCLSMRISNPIARKAYLSMYPGDKKVNNLDNLHEYESRNPATFRDMYQFWCCRKGSVTAKSPPAWFYTPGH